MADLKSLKGVSEKDRKLIADAEVLLGPEPSAMGLVKNLFWGNFRQDLVLPYPQVSAEETARCDALIAKLDKYLVEEHPALQIDQKQEIPPWVIDRLFAMGVLGMTIPSEYGGGGLGITSYNRVLERIGRVCGSTAVLVSAHQSIGCKAIMLFGTEKQKSQWLPRLAKDWLSAFCLSEPDVGCDAGGQTTRCEVSEDGQYYILNGQKKWSTSGALSSLFTVMTRQKVIDPKTGKNADKVTAIVCTPDMAGIDIFQKNRSKCGIRGTWQARIRFTNVKVPRWHLVHQEGKGLNVALSCLNYGRCTLSAGMVGAAVRGLEQSTKWAQTRYQFGRAIGEFEMVGAKIARQSALTYAMDAMLYMTTGMLDRHDEDIMVETAICKVFCSEMGWRCINDALQIMGGEGYMTENEIERMMRDARITTIVEGANEVIQSFIFAYGGKQLAEMMLGIQQALGWDRGQSAVTNLARIVRQSLRPAVMRAALPLAAELFWGWRRAKPSITRVHPSLRQAAGRLAFMVQEHSHAFKLASKEYGEKIVTRQAVQQRFAESAMWLYAWACTLSKLDRTLAAADQKQPEGPELITMERDKAAGSYFMDMARTEIRQALTRVFEHDDASMQSAAKAAFDYGTTLANERYVIPESSPVAKGTGKKNRQEDIPQFPGGDKHG